MSERDDKRGGSGCAIGLALAFLFLPVLYVLSVGPANWLVNRYPSTEGVLNVVYAPLSIAANHCQPFADAADWYLELWQ